jgi:hypothetical protein
VIAAHHLDVLLSRALAAHYIDKSFDIRPVGPPAFENVVGDRVDHGTAILAGQTDENVRPLFRPDEAA